MKKGNNTNFNIFTIKLEIGQKKGFQLYIAKKKNG